MHVFWDSVVHPVLTAADPATIVEVGAWKGENTRNLVEFAAEHESVLHVIDPEPLFDPGEIGSTLGDDFVFHRERSLNALSAIHAPDVVLIDGDHNWYTVFHELQLLEKSVAESGDRFPVVLLHDVDWPYGRRDLYYDPDAIPPAYRLPYKREGVLPNTAQTVGSHGLNPHLNNAIYQHNLRNGVRTAVEDFMSETSFDLRFLSLPGDHGLGIVAPVHQPETALPRLLDELTSPDFLLEHARRLESLRLDTLIRLREQKRSRKQAEDAATTAAQDRTAAEGELARVIEEAEQAALATARDVERLETDRTASKERERTAGQERDALRAALAESEERATRDAEQLARLVSDQQELAARLEEAGEQLQLVEERDRAAQAEYAELAERLRDTEEAAAIGELDRAQLSVDLTAREQALQELGELRDTLTSERDGFRDALAVSRAELERERAEFTRATAESRAGRSRLDEITAERDELRRKLTAESGRAREAADGRQRLQDQLAREQASRRQLHEALEGDVRRTASSRSFRYGHRVFRFLAVLAMRRPKQRTGLDSALGRISRLRELDGERPASGQPGALAGNGAEQAHRTGFRDTYTTLLSAAGFEPDGPNDVSAPFPRDSRRLLTRTPASGQASVDVIVCVKDAFADVRTCLWSVLQFTDRPLKLIVVDDGSEQPTRDLLRDLAAREPAVRLIRNDGPDHGYTRAANLGLRESSGDYAVLLNSDTIVTPGWLDALVDCGEQDPAVGVIGPLSNAASHQSVPKVKDGGSWALNELPAWMAPASVALLLAILRSGPAPRVPFVNGFCYAIKRSVLDQVGLLDEERFGAGYCEENDLSVRVLDAGFTLAVATGAYVFHAKSRSYTPEGRKKVASDHYGRFLEKHGKARVESLVAELDSHDGLERVRSSVAAALASPQATVDAIREARPDPPGVLFVLHGMAAGSSGGVHSVYQEVAGLRRLGVNARIALGGDMERARWAYPDADSVFLPFGDAGELRGLAQDARVIVATHFSTVGLLRELRSTGLEFVPAYYVQDYEPFFLAPGSPRLEEALASYTALPDLHLFAKTHWLCNVVGGAHGVAVDKVEPSLDNTLFNTLGRVRRTDPVRITAMVRPRTPRRQPAATLAALAQVATQRGADVRITTFGCEEEELHGLGAATPGRHAGILSRAEVAELLRDTDVFLDASTYQAFGRTGLEAMACGATAVLPVLGGAHEFAEHDRNASLVDTGDPDAIAGSLLRLVDDPLTLEHLQQGALDTAARYSVLGAALSEYELFDRWHRASSVRPASGNGAASNGNGHHARTTAVAGQGQR